MPKTPSSDPPPPLSPACDPRLPAAALAYRTAHNLLSQTDLGAINVTAWLYRYPQGVTITAILGVYSWRNALSGSIREARRAGV